MLAPRIHSIIHWRGTTVPLWKMPAPYFVYIVHITPAYKHAKNYCGMTGNIDQRLHAHISGHGARLVEVAIDAGCTIELTRLWPCDTYEEARELERKIKKQHRPYLCPRCNPDRKPDPLVEMRKGHWPFALFGQGKRKPILPTVGLPQFVRRILY